MGYTSSESEVGRYQIETINYDIIDLTGNDIARIPHNTIIKIDTKSGRVYEFTKFLTWDDNNEGTFEHFWVDITKD